MKAISLNLIAAINTYAMIHISIAHIHPCVTAMVVLLAITPFSKLTYHGASYAPSF